MYNKVKGSPDYEYAPKWHVCETCGNSWFGRKRKYCCKKCRDQAQGNSHICHGVLHKKCEVCGKEFDTWRSQKLTCSEECSKKRNNTRPRRKNQKGYSRKRTLLKNPDACEIGVTVRQCKLCGEDFVITGPNQWCCCKDHAKKYANQKEHEKRLAERLTKTCCVCGKDFLDWKNGSRTTCSKECSKEYNAAKMKINREKRYTEENVVDTNITLKRVFNRDGGKCYICGCDCDWTDFTRNENGYFCTGRKYPTIEHVIPLSRGGKHSWENVMLACWECNQQKSDTVPAEFYAEYAKTMPKVNTRANPAKRTLQYDLTGTLIASFNSTNEAGKLTGLRPKGIQKAARGEQKTYAGFVWKYDDAGCAGLPRAI